MGLFSSPKGPQPKFFAGQKDIGNSLFQPGGDIWALLRGAPSLGYEAGVNRGYQQLNQQLAGQGMVGQPLGDLKGINYAAQVGQGREENRLSTLLGAINPYGTGSGTQGGKGYSVGNQLLSKFVG